MSIRMILAAAAVLALGAPAFAQTAPVAPAAPAAAAEDAEDAEDAEAAFEARGEAFEAVVETMTREMQAAAAAANGDTVKAGADMDVIAARYQPQADAFADDLDAFLASQLPSMPAEAQARMAQMGPMIRGQITGVPAATKAKILAEMAAPAAPAAPATPQ